MLNKLLEDMPKRMCEKLGIPYDDDEEIKEKPEEPKKEPEYPSRKKAQKLLPQRKTATENGVYDAQNKKQVMDFFAGWADIEDTT